MPTTYFCSTSPKLILGANRLVPQVKFPDGEINRPSGTIRFKGHFAYSDAITNELNEMGRMDNERKLVESQIIKFIENSQPFKNGKITKVEKAEVEQHHATEAAVQRLARNDDDPVPENVVAQVREAAAKEAAKEPEPAGVDG